MALLGSYVAKAFSNAVNVLFSRIVCQVHLLADLNRQQTMVSAVQMCLSHS